MSGRQQIKKTKEEIEKEENSRKEKLIKLLIKMREDIIKEAKKDIKKFKDGEKKQIIETVMDDGDMSLVDLAEDISLKQLSAHREKLIKIDEAIQKIKEGTYGFCEECGDEISVERLKIIPFATHCRDCQEKKELLDKIKQLEEEP